MNGNLFGNSNFGIESLSKSMGVAQESMYYDGDNSFAPEVEDRIKTISSSLSTEIERGYFVEAEGKLKEIIEKSDSYLLNENVRKSEIGFRETRYSSYAIKVDILKYEDVILKLKEIGDVKSFNKNTEDITGQCADLELNLELEKSRLVRYQEMYFSAKDISDKIELNDRIFNQERIVKYLEDRINSLDKKVDYATIYFSMNEEKSGYSNIALIKLSELVKEFVSSVNNLLGLFFVIIPWIIFSGVLFWIYRFIKKKRR